MFGPKIADTTFNVQNYLVLVVAHYHWSSQ